MMGPKKRTKRDDTQLYCVCRKVDDGEKFMVHCDLCSNWFHGECVGVSHESVPKGKWFCDSCTALNHTRSKLMKEIEDLLAKSGKEKDDSDCRLQEVAITTKLDNLTVENLNNGADVALKNALSAKSKLEKENASLLQEITEMKLKLLGLSNDLDNCKASNDQCRKEMNEKLISANNVIEVLTMEKATLLQASAINTKTTGNNNNMEKAVTLRELADSKSTIDNLKESLVKADESYKNTLSMKTELKEENVALRLKIADLEGKLLLLENDKDNWEDAFKLFETDMKEKLADADKVIENLKVEKTELQAKLRSTNNKRRLTLSQKQNV